MLPEPETQSRLSKEKRRARKKERSTEKDPADPVSRAEARPDEGIRQSDEWAAAVGRLSAHVMHQDAPCRLAFGRWNLNPTVEVMEVSDGSMRAGSSRKAQ